MAAMRRMLSQLRLPRAIGIVTVLCLLICYGQSTHPSLRGTRGHDHQGLFISNFTVAAEEGAAIKGKQGIRKPNNNGGDNNLFSENWGDESRAMIIHTASYHQEVTNNMRQMKQQELKTNERDPEVEVVVEDEKDACKLFVAFSDLNSDGYLDQDEYVVLVNLLSETHLTELFEELPEPLSQQFEELAGEEQRIKYQEPTALLNNLHSSVWYPFQHNRQEQAEADMLSPDTICHQTKDAIAIATRQPEESFTFATLGSFQGLETTSTLLPSQENILSGTESPTILSTIQNSTVHSNISAQSKAPSVPLSTLVAEPRQATSIPETPFPTPSPNITLPPEAEKTLRPTNETQPPRPPDFVSQSIITGYNSWIMSNPIGMTVREFNTGTARISMREAYGAFTHEVVGEMAKSRPSLSVRFSNRRLSVSIQAGGTAIADAVDSICPVSTSTLSPATKACITVFGQVELEVVNEDPDLVYEEYVDLSQLAIEAGVLQKHLDAVDPGLLWSIEESSSPVDPDEGLPEPPPEEEDPDVRGGFDLNRGLLVSGAIAIVLVFAICLCVILPQMRKNREMNERKKDALERLWEAERKRAAFAERKAAKGSAAAKQMADAMKEKKHGPPWPKHEHDQWDNPYREIITRLIQENCPEKMDELDSLLYQFRGREPELIAVLEEYKLDESMLNEDSEVAVEWDSESSASIQVPDDVPPVTEHVPEIPVPVVVEAEASNSEDESEREESKDDSSEKSESSEIAASRSADPPEIAESRNVEPDVNEKDDADSFLSERSEEVAVSESESEEDLPDLKPISEKTTEAMNKPETEPSARPSPEPSLEPETTRTPSPVPSESETTSTPPPAPNIKDYSEPDKTVADETAFETMEDSDWDSSSSSEGYVIQWHQENGYWRSEKVWKGAYEYSESDYESDTDSSEGMVMGQENERFRWVQRNGNWEKQLIVMEDEHHSFVDEEDEEMYISSESESSEEEAAKWVRRNGQWVHE